MSETTIDGIPIGALGETYNTKCDASLNEDLGEITMTSKKYFFESDDGFVKLSWEDVRKVCPDVVVVAINEDGDIFAHVVQPNAIRGCYYSDANSIYLGTLAYERDNWEPLIFYPPTQVTDEVKAAIKLLFPDAKCIAMDKDGEAYVYTLKPVISSMAPSMWVGIPASRDFRIPAIDCYSDDWENSLIEL